MMTEKEIVRAYRSSPNLHQAIKDLAKSNGTTVEAIYEILRRRNYVPPVIPKPSRPGAGPAPVSATRLVGLVEQGATAEEIAEELGVSYGQALILVARLFVLCEEYIATAGESVKHTPLV